MNKPFGPSWLVRLPISAALILATFLLLAPGATGHHGPDSMYKTVNLAQNCSTSIYCHTDNASFTYFRESSLNSTAKGNIATILSEKYNPTDLNVIHESPPAYTGGAETDVIYQVNSSAVPWYAQATTWCDDPIDSVKCDQHYVAFKSNDVAINNAIACHETGHTVGLTHGEDAYPPMSSTDSNLGCLAVPSPYSLPVHQTSQINAIY